jgi:RNA polymerase sigma factor (sigma-70 family)
VDWLGLESGHAPSGPDGAFPGRIALSHRPGFVRHGYDEPKRRNVTMDEQNFLAERFEANRSHLRRVAYRMLGSLNEADDAVQEAWLRLARSDTTDVRNLSGWLTTVVARVCLDMLRGRKSRREEPIGPHVPEPAVDSNGGIDPEQEAQMADSVGLALLVVLETLAPAERIAFVLHDMFDLPFEEIAPIVGRSEAAARQLASRARRRVQGGSRSADADRAADQQVVDAFLAASRNGDFEGLLAVLDPDVVVRADDAAARLGGSYEMRGAGAVARAFLGRAQAARSALVDGTVGAVVAPHGQLLLVVRFTIANGRIIEIDAVGNPERLEQFDLAVLDG